MRQPQRSSGSGAHRYLSRALHGLETGAIDAKIRRVSLERFRQVFEIASCFRPGRSSFTLLRRKVLCVLGAQVAREQHRHLDAARPPGRGLDTRIAWKMFTRPIPDASGFFSMRSRRARRLLLRHGHFNAFAHRVSRPGSKGSGPGSSRSTSTTTGAPSTSTFPSGRDFPFTKLFAMLKERTLAPILTVEATRRRIWRGPGQHRVLASSKGSAVRSGGRTAAPPQRTMPARGGREMLRYVARRFLFMIPSFSGSRSSVFPSCTSRRARRRTSRRR